VAVSSPPPHPSRVGYDRDLCTTKTATNRERCIDVQIITIAREISAFCLFVVADCCFV